MYLNKYRVSKKVVLNILRRSPRPNWVIPDKAAKHTCCTFKELQMATVLYSLYLHRRLLEAHSMKNDTVLTSLEIPNFWEFEDGTPFNFSSNSFIPYQPNNYKGSDSCMSWSRLLWYSNTTGGLVDRSCWGVTGWKVPSHLCATPMNTPDPSWGSEFPSRKFVH
jgi:hypothetical protein